jgi:DNA polymerase-3 subunit alpha
MLLGFYVSGNPLEDYKEFLPSINSPASGDLSVLKDRDCFTICGILGTVSKKITKKDNRAWAFFTLETKNAQYKMNCFPDVDETLSHQLKEGVLVLVTGNAQARDTEIALHVNALEPLNDAMERLRKIVTWLLNAETNHLATFVDELKDFVDGNDGTVEHVLIFEFCDGRQEKAKLAESLRRSLNVKKYEVLGKMPP